MFVLETFACVSCKLETASSQVRVKGHVQKVDPAQSIEYFHTRPRISQVRRCVCLALRLPNTLYCTYDTTSRLLFDTFYILQISAWSSEQSRPVSDRDALLNQYKTKEVRHVWNWHNDAWCMTTGRKIRHANWCTFVEMLQTILYCLNLPIKFQEYFKDCEVIPLPQFWGGFRLKPSSIEFWQVTTFTNLYLPQRESHWCWHFGTLFLSSLLNFKHTGLWQLHDSRVSCILRAGVGGFMIEYFILWQAVLLMIKEKFGPRHDFSLDSCVWQLNYRQLVTQACYSLQCNYSKMQWWNYQ